MATNKKGSGGRTPDFNAWNDLTADIEIDKKGGLKNFLPLLCGIKPSVAIMLVSIAAIAGIVLSIKYSNGSNIGYIAVPATSIIAVIACVIIFKISKNEYTKNTTEPCNIQSGEGED